MAIPVAAPTCFAPAERASQDQLGRQARCLGRLSAVRVMLDAVPNVVMVLNRHRQLVYCNQALLQLLGMRHAGEVLGLRPGEVLRCIHSCETDGGCGTTEFCSACGAVKAILSSQVGNYAVEECHITRKGRGGIEALDLRVWASPFNYEREPFTIFSAADIGHEKRRVILERVFLHDITNLVMGLGTLTDAGRTAREDSLPGVIDQIGQLTRYLAEEISAHRDLVAAETGELRVTLWPVSTLSLLRQAAEAYGAQAADRGMALRVSPDAVDVELVTDAVLARRVIGNMVTNALEACQAGAAVTLGCRRTGDQVQLWVHNPGEIPREIQLQLFQRSFSTRGPARGLGTYSMKLLGEQYLKGQVSFTSSAEHGTEFVLACPILPG